MDITPEKVLEIQRYAREPISWIRRSATRAIRSSATSSKFRAVVAVDAVSFTLLQDQLVGAGDALRARSRRRTVAFRPDGRSAPHP